MKADSPKQNPPKKKAISYLRYSTKKQAAGGSEKRQLDWTLDYCEKNNLELVDTYKDLGISAHRGKHSKEGNLARLLDDCESGKIPKGYVLVIENFDRLSREEVPVALQRFLTLLNEYKLEIHTLDDSRVYTPDKIEVTELIITIVIMGRAHSESARKSVFSSKAWKQVREAGKAFSKPGKNPLGCPPAWLSWDSEGQQWIVDDAMVSTIKYIFQLAIKNKLGRYQIAQRLNEEKVPLIAKRAKQWTANSVRTIMINRSLLGEFVPRNSKDPDAETIKGYYPVILDEEVFDNAARLVTKRNTKTTGRPPKHKHQYAVLTGFCFWRGFRVNKSSYCNNGVVKPTYTCLMADKNRYLGLADQLEHFICSLVAELDKADLQTQKNNQAYIIKLETELSSEKKKLDSLSQAQASLMKAVELAGDELPDLVVNLQQRQREMVVVKDSIKELYLKLEELATSSGVHDQEKVSKLKKQALEVKDLQSRQELHVTLKQLVKRLDFAKDLEDLPHCSQEFMDLAVALQIDSPIKYWARIELFNDAVILGVMAPNGKIARIRWEEE